jgi:hypothetical protein
MPETERLPVDDERPVPYGVERAALGFIRVDPGLTLAAGREVSPKDVNLSMSAPEQSPMRTTASAMSTAGTARTHSRAFVNARNGGSTGRS